MERIVLIAIIIFLVLGIIYITQKQNFDVYTSGSLQRYASEFTGTNQSPQIYTQLALNSSLNSNSLSNFDKGTENLESELFRSTLSKNLSAPIVML